MAFIVFFLVIGNALPASAVPMKLSATYDAFASIEGVWYDRLPLTYNAYYNSDSVTTSIYAPVEMVGSLIQGYTQSVSLDYWEMLYVGDVIIRKSGGNIYYDYSDPTVLNLIYADEGLTTAEMPYDNVLDLKSYSSASIGSDLSTWAAGTMIGDIQGLSGYGNLVISEMSVPEPSALYLLLGALIGLGILQKKNMSIWLRC